jgi:signal transduction histidine kinase
MNSAAVSLPQRRRLLLRRGLLLPIVLAGLVQVDIWGGRFALGHMVGPRPVIALLYAVTSLSLIWCPRAPLAVLAFIVTADSAVYIAFGAPEGLGSFLPLWFAFFAVGRYSERGNVVFAAPLVFVGIAIHELTDPVYSFGGSDAVFYIGLAAAWPLGYAFRRRALEREALVEAQEHTAREAVAAERARIARELHDVVGHGLSVIVLQLVAALSQLEDPDPQDPLRARLLGVERSARDALAEMRRLLDLVDDGAGASLAPQPGLAQLERLVEDTRAAGAEIELDIRGQPTELPTGVDLAAFRILQESLTNVLKHARPPKAFVSVSYQRDAVIVEVLDQGAHPAVANASGRGLAGMRERVALYGGELDLGPRPEGGFGVRARLPSRQ